ncbi:MAG: M56 family metallopeptidase [Planctomycetaceae bacterium]|nr:M56 family metallopeptidase [Planctomycetaceae bacterium]
MNTIFQLIDPLFDRLVILQLAAFLFFGIAVLLRRLTPEPVERIRVTVTAFCAIPLLFAVGVTPFIPRWSIAVWHETADIPQEYSSAETAPAMTTANDFASMPQDRDETATHQNLDPRGLDSLAYVSCTDSGGHGVAILPLLLYYARGCAVAGFIAAAFVMIVGQLVAVIRLRWMMRSTLPVPEWDERFCAEEYFPQRARKPQSLLRGLFLRFRCETIQLRVSQHIDSPLLVGLLCPTIVLPMSMALDENSEQTRYALAHELTHHRHGDLRTWHLVHLCRLLFWLQPFYWHLAKELRVDQDFLADDAASRINSTSRTGMELYASMLVELAKRRTINAMIDRWSGQSPVLGFADTTPLLTRRIEMLLKEKPRLRKTTCPFLLLTICGMFFGLAVMFGAFRLTTIAAGTLPAEPPTTSSERLPETADEPQDKPENPMAASLGKFDMDKYVPVRGRVILPEGETLERASLLMRALSSDNEMGLYGDNENVMKDGTFQRPFHANANYAIVVKDRENPSLTSEIYHLEIGDETPKEEVAIPLVKATAMIEGQVLNAKTGKPIPEIGLIFCQYFEMASKKDGKTLIWPLSYYVLTKLLQSLK